MCTKACGQSVQLYTEKNVGLLMKERCIFDGEIMNNSMCQIKSLWLPRGIWPAHGTASSILAVVFFGAFVA